MLTRAQWALDEDGLKTMQERAAYFELDNFKDFEDFEKGCIKKRSYPAYGRFFFE